jgi:two-component system chemotaxis response regulator CheB
MPVHDIVVIGASAGGVEALVQLVGGLPKDLPAAVCIVLHLPAHGSSVMPLILDRAKTLPACHAADQQPIERGHVYVAPPDHHLHVERGYLRLTRGPSENGVRPSVDPLFRTAARAYGGRVIGIVLSGVLDDGTAGLMTIKAHGGLALVQAPEDALYSGMPRSAIENVDVDCVLPVAKMAARLVELVHLPAQDGEELPDGRRGAYVMENELEQEAEVAETDETMHPSDVRPGRPSGFTCPECHGALWEMQAGDLIRFRCQVGHAYTANTLLAEQSEALEAAMWTAFRALRESYQLSRRLEKRARDRGSNQAAERFCQQAEDAEQRAETVRMVLAKGNIFVGEELQMTEAAAHEAWKAEADARSVG